LGSALVLLLLLPEIGRKIFDFDLKIFKKMTAYAWPLVIVGLAGIVNETLDRAVMKYILPGNFDQNQSELGIYGANYKLAMLISIFTQAYRYAAEPFFFRNQHDQNARENMAKAGQYFALVGSAMMLGVLLFLPILKSFIAEKYHSGLHIVPILLLANLFLGLNYNFSVWYRLKDLTKIGAKISLAGAAVTIIFLLLLVPKIGITGAALATLICYAFLATVTLVIGQKHLPIPYKIGRMSIYILSSLAVAGIGYFCEKNQNILYNPLIINALLFFGWIGFIYFYEKNKI
jgi:O-antigen/teichoic acid export membrane protein